MDREDVRVVQMRGVLWGRRQVRWGGPSGRAETIDGVTAEGESLLTLQVPLV